ncbi:MAG: hypothetical protein P8Z00_22575 [Anaerolineales bacterium]|jgi:hypothetical protein
MPYLAELYYLQDQKDFPFQKAVRVTATAVSRWSSFFYAKLIFPKSKQIGLVEKSGTLPKDAQNKETFVAETVNWLFENSSTDELFSLFLDDEPAPKPGKLAKFDHHDDTCCWVLNLLESEFAELQSIWRAYGLPIDLFYPEQSGVHVMHPGMGLKARLLRAFRVTKYYTPKQWERETKRETG